MNPRARRILITLLVLAFAVIVILPMLFPAGQRPTPTPADSAAQDPTQPETPAETTTDSEEPDADPPAGEPEDAASQPPSEEGQPETAEANGNESPEAPETPAEPMNGLHAVAPDGPLSEDQPPQTVGSSDWRVARILVKFTPHAAGIEAITFSDIWETAPTRREVERIKAEILAGTKTLDDLPAGERYILRGQDPYQQTAVPVLAVHSLKIGDQRVSLFGEVWSEIEPGHFVTEVRDENEEPVLRLERRFVLARYELDPTLKDDPNVKRGYDLTLRQQVANLSDRPLEVQLLQYGPPSLRVAHDRYMDRRRFRFGYGPDRANFPDLILSRDNKLLYEHNKLIKEAKKAAALQDRPREQMEKLTLWPNATTGEKNYELSWFGSTNRYFALAVHPARGEPGAGSKYLGDIVREIRFSTLGAGDAIDKTVLTYLVTEARQLEAAGAENSADTTSFDMGVYAGPLDRHILDKEEPYVSLAMHGLILYQMSSCCAMCTFQWLAELLLSFLTLLHDYVLFDWGLAIIGLVIVVRAILHPVTKKSQISMQRFQKKTAALQPELEKLKKKYGDDPKRMQQEQMRLWKERGISPLGCLGMAPMFLQMPIWVALYAMLYFVFDLRQMPAFFGIFQLFADWPFLGDLSAPDQFISLPFQGRFMMFDYSAINILPLVMGAVFFFQQKYMSPPPSASMSKEQVTQQKMMKIMMVVMFPIMLYSAPSGLTLYILTSSSIGILESKYIRAHIKEMDLNPPKKQKKNRKKKPRDPQGRAYAASLEAAQQKRRQKMAGPPKKFKKRK